MAASRGFFGFLNFEFNARPFLGVPARVLSGRQTVTPPRIASPQVVFSRVALPVVATPMPQTTAMTVPIPPVKNPLTTSAAAAVVGPMVELLLEEQHQLEIDHANSMAELEKSFRSKISHYAEKIKKAQRRLSIDFIMNLNQNFDLPKPHLFKQSSQAYPKYSSSPSPSSKKS